MRHDDSSARYRYARGSLSSRTTAAHPHGADAKPEARTAGRRRGKDNARERVIRPVVKHADELLARRGHQPLPLGVTAHKLRHTFTSIPYVCGEGPPYVMAQLGHTDPGFPLPSTPARCAATRATRSA